jgi:hypothetical protein
MLTRRAHLSVAALLLAAGPTLSACSGDGDGSSREKRLTMCAEFAQEEQELSGLPTPNDDVTWADGMGPEGSDVADGTMELDGVTYEFECGVKGDEVLWVDWNEVEDDLPTAPPVSEEPAQDVDLAAGGTPVTFKYSDGGAASVALLGPLRYLPGDPSAGDDVHQRSVNFRLKVSNIGALPIDPSHVDQAHFVSDSGRVYDFSGVFCQEGDHLPDETIDVGQFAEGCVGYYVPNQAGRLVFEDDLGTKIFITVSAP